MSYDPRLNDNRNNAEPELPFDKLNFDTVVPYRESCQCTPTPIVRCSDTIRRSGIEGISEKRVVKPTNNGKSRGKRVVHKVLADEALPEDPSRRRRAGTHDIIQLLRVGDTGTGYDRVPVSKLCGASWIWKFTKDAEKQTLFKEYGYGYKSKVIETTTSF